jgi:hypothetical protein
MLSQSWTNFAVVVGAASGALTGLLFVAVSLNVQRLVERPALRASAAQTLLLFVLSLLLAILLVVPNQVRWVLGVEITVLGICAGAAMFAIGRQKHEDEQGVETGLARLVDRISPNLVTSLLITVAGISVLADAGGGLDWLVPAVIIALAGGVANTWFFLTRLPS